MKRDLDLLRDMLLRIEEAESEIENSDFNDLSDNPQIIAFHIQLLIDADFIASYDISTLGNPNYFVIQRLTFAGCEYLDAVRDKGIWGQAKQKLSSVGGSASLDVVTSLCSALAKTQLGI
ncbi:DUF2513 domain-containing protein [uncultured Selenomonas sp.]|jgi:hypothetical protein|uniref:DUF2513 domain-containing protein n=1 Tax=uncultured Selenomonas sp. TaxID=159275 RepID=UPI0028E643E7|nr:DUF2513 domain-containing protein [uncultured Selenomonas sp.]